MKNYQIFHYDEYRIMLPDGETVRISRQECFAPAEEPTNENPYKQRWFYSPDHYMAIRLPRNELGERTHRMNAAELKYEEREEMRKSMCVAQALTAMCPITCGSCCFADCCRDFKHKSENGKGCRRKCEECGCRQSRSMELDKPIGVDDNGYPMMYELPAGTDIERDYIQAEEEEKCRAAVAAVLAVLGEVDLEICRKKKRGISNVEIGKELGISEGAVRKRIRKMRDVFEKAGLKNFLNEE